MRAARRLARAFRDGGIAKTYWAVVVGVPRPAAGEIDQPLAKAGGRMGADAEGRAAVTRYRTIAASHGKAAWLALMPLTGRTHQLRVHCTLLGTPIAGDRKYGGRGAPLAAAGGRLQLHARELVLPYADGGNLRLRAPLPAHMAETFAALGFDPDSPRAEAPE